MTRPRRLKFFRKTVLRRPPPPVRGQLKNKLRVYNILYKYLGPAVQIEIGPVACAAACVPRPIQVYMTLPTIVFIIL